MFRDGDRGWDISDVCAIVRDRLKPHFAPGSGIRYSDTNNALLGHGLEHRSQRALFDGQLFAAPSTLSLVTSGWRRFGLPLDRAALRAPSWPIEYSLGFMRFQLPRALYGMRRMPSLLGHTGSSGPRLFLAPERQLFFVGTVDEVTSGAVPHRLLPRLLRVMEKLGVSHGGEPPVYHEEPTGGV